MRMHTLAAIIAASLAAAMAPARAVEASADNDSGVQASAARDEGVSDQGGAADQDAGSDRSGLTHGIPRRDALCESGVLGKPGRMPVL